MNREELNDLLVVSRIAGLLDGLSTMEGATISKAAAIRMEEASDRLLIYIGTQFAKGVDSDEGTEEAFTRSTP